MTLFRSLLLLVLAGLSAIALEAKDQEETVFIFQNRQVAIRVPAGLGFAQHKDPNGQMVVQLADPKQKVSLELTFSPDPDARFGSARGRKEFMNDSFQAYLKDSVEQAMQFEELDPKVGGGTYCVFTDAHLVGQAKLPPGEFLHVVTGLKTWPGVVAVFTIATNDLQAKDYAALLAVLRESVQEKPVSPLR